MKISKHIEVNALNENEYETCVLCHELTHVKKDTELSKRDCYVEGSGQLCERCYAKLYLKKK